MDEGGSLAGVSLVVAAETSIAADPCERALHNPPLGQHDEAAEVRALDDLKRPGAGLFHHGGHLRSLVAAVADDALDEREAPARLAEQGLRSVAILHAGGVHIHVQQQAERVDEDVALAAENLLARIKPLRIKRAPPFTAPLALCVSMIAVVGLASRPACSRHSV